MGNLSNILMPFWEFCHLQLRRNQLQPQTQLLFCFRFKCLLFTSVILNPFFWFLTLNNDTLMIKILFMIKKKMSKDFCHDFILFAFQSCNCLSFYSIVWKWSSVYSRQALSQLTGFPCFNSSLLKISLIIAYSEWANCYQTCLYSGVDRSNAPITTLQSHSHPSHALISTFLQLVNFCLVFSIAFAIFMNILIRLIFPIKW